MSGPYIGKYKRDWNETWFIDRWQWEEVHCTRIMSHLKVQCVTDTIGESMYVHMYNVIIEHSKVQCVTDTKVIANDNHDFTNVT